MSSKIVFSVSELNQASQKILEQHFPAIWVEGEISNLKKYPSGHIYFSLKDPKAHIRCVFFRYQAEQCSVELKEGLLVQLLGKVSLYPDRGDYQLIVQEAVLAGEGLLKKRFDDLVKKLSKEGLFEQQHKKPLPKLPNAIGIVSSKEGAALRDILSVLARRFPSIPVIIYPALVQGQQAVGELIRAIRFANEHDRVDVLILARGGGSLEDLWSFNDEQLARTIFESRLPIISGVGHEIDFTIADFVADQRAPTPSAAAELVVPDYRKWLEQFQRIEQQLIRLITERLQRYAQTVDWLTKRLVHPGKKIQQQLDKVLDLRKQLQHRIKHYLQNQAQVLSALKRTLHSISPMATLERGYAIVFDEDNHVVHSSEKTHLNQTLQIKLKDGTLKTRVVD